MNDKNALPELQPRYPASVAPNAVRGKLLELLGLPNIPVTVDVSTGRRQISADGLEVVPLAYRNSLSETVPGILISPHGSDEMLPGIVCMPGTSMSAEALAQEDYEHDAQKRLVGWGRELARRGFVTLCLSIKGCAGREATQEEWQNEAKALAPYGITQMGVGIEEALLGARVLASQTQVDAGRIGLTGFSLGGNFTWYAIACANWIAAAAPLCGGLGSLSTFIRSGDMARHSAYYFIPHMLRCFDHAEVVAACIAPRPLMLLAPTMDEDMPRAGVEQLMAAVSPVYVEAGHPERFKVYQPESNHIFRKEYFEWMAAWFATFLHPKTEISS